MDYLLTFHTQLDAVIARNKVRKEGKGDCRLQPVPRVLSSSCGTCATVKDGDLSFLKKLEHAELYRIENGQYIREDEQ
ncbi:MAG: DUF3343 domain-containing protein [Spirochaetia bacterium]|jgi:hypothetical protein|nr:DUF3343 domain-containing protein [Spirochaetia bacterium]